MSLIDVNESNLAQIDRLLESSESNYSTVSTIPTPDALTYSNGYNVICGVVFVDIRQSSTLTEKHTLPVLAKIYRAYVSVMIRCIKASSLHKHIRVVGDSVMGIINVPNPATDMNELFELAASMSSSIDLLNMRLAKRSYAILDVGIGISFGKSLMIKAGAYGTGEHEVLWMGRPINRASKLCSYGNRDRSDGDCRIMVDRSVFEKLSADYKSMLTFNQKRDCYTGDLNYRSTNDFIKSLPTYNFRPPLSALLAPPATSSSPPLFGLGTIGGLQNSNNSALSALANYGTNSEPSPSLSVSSAFALQQLLESLTGKK